ncbi:MAG: acetylxylan esterase, partial [Verrucomicrobiales bacterium]
MNANLLIVVLLLVSVVPAAAKDARLGELRSLDSYHPFREYAPDGASDAERREAWEKRAAQIRLRVKVAAGIYPEPTRTPLEPVIHGRREMDGYTIEKVYFQSIPGHYVSGNLYRPTGPVPAGGRPAVLCPHGHWKGGRFLDEGGDARPGGKVANALAIGAERFVAAARSPLQARCVQLARMGCVVFHYDMLAYADSIQFPVHKSSPRAQLDSLREGQWGFASPAAAARLQSSFGLQTWNSVRALDFLLTLPEVDAKRVAVTGASGGGTQSMMLAAVDQRVAAAFPAVMPSSAMQGGCTCENCYLLRIGQGNIDIVAAIAPRPLGITAADDWSIELESKGHPDLVDLYKLLGAPSNYEAHFNIHFKHNYNHVSRTQMYGFLNRHFKLGFEQPVLESDFKYLGREDLTVWDEAHPPPSGPEIGDAHARSLCLWMTRDARRQVRALLEPVDGAARSRAREVLGKAWGVMLGRPMPAAHEVESEMLDKQDRGDWLLMRGQVRNSSHGEEIAVVFCYPKNWAGKVALWVHPQGSTSLFGPAGPGGVEDTPRPEVRKLLDAGYAVVGADLFAQSEGAK